MAPASLPDARLVPNINTSTKFNERLILHTNIWCISNMYHKIYIQYIIEYVLQCCGIVIGHVQYIKEYVLQYWDGVLLFIFKVITYYF